MRWLTIGTFCCAVLLLGISFVHRARAGDDLSAKVQALEKQVARLEKRVAELEKRLNTLELTALLRQHTFPGQLLIERLERFAPKQRPDFNLPVPAPNPFVQPYYYPLERSER